MGEYSGNHPRFSRKQEERYDAKEAHNKSLSDSARLHYLENDETHHPAKQNLADSADIRDMSGAYNAMGDANHPLRQEDEIGGASRVGQTADGKVITHDPEHSDLSLFGRTANKMQIFSGSQGQYPGDYLDSKRRKSGPTGSVNRWGETKIGANFFPPENKVEGKTVPSTPNPFTEGNRSGGTDTMFNDSRQDGTMLGRGIRRFQNWWNR